MLQLDNHAPQIGTRSATWMGSSRFCSGKAWSDANGGSEKHPYVELPLRSSLMATSAATVFLKMPCAVAMGAISALVQSFLVHGSPLAEGDNTGSMVASQSRASLDMSSPMKGSRRSRPVRLSYFFRILASPAMF